MSVKSVLITGASTGIGRAAARVFAENGYKLYLMGFTHARELREYGVELSTTYSAYVEVFTGDLRETKFIEETIDGIPSLTTVVNCAAIAKRGAFSFQEPEEIERLISVNLTGSINVCRFALPKLLAGDEGRIINISSVWGLTGGTGEVVYSASKGGINSFTKALAKELAPNKIAVNAIAFGAVDTDMNRNVLSGDEISELEKKIPFGRMATPREAADFIYSLANVPTYLTGQIIAFDGGWI